MDYEEVIDEQLVFNTGDTRVCHSITILQDNVCESDPNEFFFSDLSHVSGQERINIDPPTAQVIINDTNEPECEYINVTVIT